MNPVKIPLDRFLVAVFRWHIKSPVRQSIRQNGLPFRPTNDPFYSESNQRALKKSMKELEEGKVVIRSMEELEKMADE